MTGTPPQGQKIPLIVLVGPTAVGKTAFSIELAQRINGEIISADSVQVYRHLDIGAAKPTVAERRLVPHHLIDVVEPNVNFTAYDYQRMAREKIAEVYARGRQPLLTGGTGLYIKAVLDGFTFSSGKSNVQVRKRLQEELTAGGNDYLYRRLQEQDPQSAEHIHPNDAKRVMRALEFIYLTGEPIGVQKERTAKKDSPYKSLLFGLYMDREQLYSRINMRAEQMIEQGLLNEVKGLLHNGNDKNMKSMQALGYRHMIAYLEGEWDMETALLLLQRDTRRYAKRQLTWFCADPKIRWSHIKNGASFNKIMDNISTQLAGY